MGSLSNEHLLEAYGLALELNLEEAFIQMLSQERDRRGLSSDASRGEEGK